MKNFLFCICFLISSIGFGQGYIPIFEGYDSVRWNNVFRWAVFFEPIYGAYTQSAFIDSLVNENNTQYKVYWYDDNGRVLNKRRILVREDTSEHKVYATLSQSYSEHLIYDFNVMRGDQFLMPMLLQNGGFEDFACFAEVTSVKTEFIAGKNRKLIELDVEEFITFPCPQKIIWIEGIGTRLGFDYFNMWHYLGDQDAVDTLCLFKNGNRIYGQGDCKVDTVINLTPVSNTHIENNLQIVPNPTDNQLLVKTTNQNLLSGKIKITNLSGQLLFEKEVNFQSEIRIEEVEKLKAGIYFISLENEEGFAVRKFLKQ